ncbi:MAG: rRNA pseudouridine synthase [Eubacterium sp.]|nr:rRNA pseudouridine synthase [Eubacterium sp.]
MRLDKFLCEMNIGTRSQVKDFIRKGLVSINGNVAKKPEEKVAPDKDCISFKGEVLAYQQFYYYMLNKPQGVVSATKDNLDKTVLDLIKTDRKDIFPVGRLDKDTEGLLLLTNDGELAHNMLSPKKHVDKTYLVTIKKELLQEEINALEQGVDIGDDKPTASARVEVIDASHIHLTIREGRFHQVKRMLKAVDNEVLALKRISFGPLTLDESLLPGESRELTAQEVALIHEA